MGSGDRTCSPAIARMSPPCSGPIDVFCISSIYEGTPLALFEAMAAGKAIVSTAVDGCREVLAGRRHRAPRAAAGSGQPWPRPSPRRSTTPPAARSAWPSEASEASGGYDIARLRREDGRSLRRGAPRAEDLEMPPLRKLGRNAREAWEVPRDLLLGRYPDFVTGGPLAPWPRPRLRVPQPGSGGLRRKGRATSRRTATSTLSADEYFQVPDGRAPRPQNAPWS